MAYYHILKERRTNLKLSIQDVSNQTRLAPQYIQAIEEHNLDVFSDDLSFVRYFVHAYSDAIGVNWQAISDEVDVDVNEFAHQRDMALTMAQRRMVEQMASPDWNHWIGSFILDQCGIAFDFKSKTSNAARAS